MSAIDEDVWKSQSSSKAGLFEVDYYIKFKPTIIILKVGVEGAGQLPGQSGPSSTPPCERVHSQKLRHEVINTWMHSRHGNVGYDNTFAVKLDAGK
jgi:hypothetical protein